MEVTLLQLLQAREARAAQQKDLLARFRCPLISFTMNIAGPVKTSPLIRRAFQAGLDLLDSRLDSTLVRFRSTQEDITGCQAMYAVDMNVREMKRICTAIEEETPLGRLYDMDVLDVHGTKLERSTQRGCIVCGAPGRACAAGRLHPVSQIQEATKHIMTAHFAVFDRDRIAALAVQSLLEEVHTTPKPGLVDRRNTGSHVDMDMHTFAASAHALEAYFRQCVEIGQSTCLLTPAETFPALRTAGLEAEQSMYRATNGINTHKGAIYTMGVLCGSLGRLWTPEMPIANTDAVLSQCAQMTADAVQADLASIDSSTAGGRLYRTLGLTGIRGQVAAGLPAVANISLPVYESCLQQGLSANDAGAVTLLHLIANVEDTNMYHRGGADGAAFAADAARALLPAPTTAQIQALDDAFIARNLSPGGCADLLAVTYFLHHLRSCSKNRSAS